MAINVLLWDKPTNMNKYEECIRTVTCQDTIITFKTEESELEAILKQTIPDIFMGDITCNREEKIKWFHIIKDNNPNIQLICIGNKSTALDAWECKCMDYILKPVTKEKLKKSILHAIKELEKEKVYRDTIQTFIFKNGESWINLKYDEIIYFEKFNKKINVKTTKDRYAFYSSFEHLRNMIDMDYFLQCHQGYIVNRYKVLCISNDTIYLNGSDISIPVSRRFKKKIVDLMEIKDS